jgi:hypothetical protein
MAHQQAAIMAYNNAFDFIRTALIPSILTALLTRFLPTQPATRQARRTENR